MALSSEQRVVLIGMAGAAIFSLSFVLMAYRFAAFEPPPGDSGAERIVYTLRCDFWAVFALLAGIGRVAGQRFLSNEIDGTAPARSRALQVNRTYIQNTTEQTLLLLFAHIGLALVVSHELLRLIPILVALFLIGRITFWAGYHHSAQARAFGFATTFYPTVVSLLYVGFRLAGVRHYFGL